MRALALMIAVTGCVTNHLGPGVLRTDWQQPGRDPDPTSDFTKEQTENPWVPEAQQHASQPVPGAKRELATRIAATLAAVFAGSLPLLVWFGTFDEDLLFVTKPPAESKPAEPKPAEPKPAEPKPAEPKPAD